MHCLRCSGVTAQLPQALSLRLDKIFSFVEGQARKKVVQISDVGQTVWQRVQAKAHLTVSPYHGTFTVAEEDAPPKISWDERLESAQADRYMLHLNTYIAVNKQDYRWIDAANHHSKMLSVTSLAHQFGYEFAGTSHVALVLKQAARIGQPATGLRIVFELNRHSSNNAHYKAMITLLMSNVLSRFLKPIVIVTDLGDQYNFYWLDDHSVLLFS